ncbi:uncharacterized protein LOC105644398 isoform X1 [Jatropha curcas]|uniref:uncharacterized protein LOC105644398 isoform X1 n=1 Tax=Jatropha curcas TaxID=180498 RepID=UPI0009D6493A|nr:uncharacterized protein LOC105644398 isoform X1 [Jatropha curcas]
MDWSSWFRRSNKKDNSPNQRQQQEEEELFGVTHQLIDHVRSFTVDTFKNFPLQDEEERTSGASFSDEIVPSTSASVRKDLSLWQERHATLVLSKVKVFTSNFAIYWNFDAVGISLWYILLKDFFSDRHKWKQGMCCNLNFLYNKQLGMEVGKAERIIRKFHELSQLRFLLCPRHLKEREFWRIYFTLVKSHVAEYELRAVRLAKLKKMAMENEISSDSSAFEVEMGETKHAKCSQPPSPRDRSLIPIRLE